MSAATASPTSSSKPSVTFPTSTHLDPAAYVRGHHAITLGAHVLVHPRCQLIALHGLVTVGEGCVVSERCVVGGPVSVDHPLAPGQLSHRGEGASVPLKPPSLSVSVDAGTPSTTTTDRQETHDCTTRIGRHVHLHPAVSISHSTTIGACSVLEPNVFLEPDVVVGRHCKICAGVTLPRGTSIPDWTVVMGDGDRRRRRRRRRGGQQQQQQRWWSGQSHASAAPDPVSADHHASRKTDAVGEADGWKEGEGREEDEEDEMDEAERARLQAMAREREGTITILKNAVLKTASGGGVRRPR